MIPSKGKNRMAWSLSLLQKKKKQEKEIGSIFFKLQSVHSAIEIQRPSLCIVMEYLLNKTEPVFQVILWFQYIFSVLKKKHPKRHDF